MISFSWACSSSETSKSLEGESTGDSAACSSESATGIVKGGNASRADSAVVSNVSAVCIDSSPTSCFAVVFVSTLAAGSASSLTLVEGLSVFGVSEVSLADASSTSSSVFSLEAMPRRCMISFSWACSSSETSKSLEGESTGDSAACSSESATGIVKGGNASRADSAVVSNVSAVCIDSSPTSCFAVVFVSTLAAGSASSLTLVEGLSVFGVSEEVG